MGYQHEAGLREQIGKLEAELAKEREKVNELAHQKGALIDRADTYYQKLAAAQATIEQMRRALQTIVKRANYRDVLEIANMAHEALALPTNFDALHEVRAAECERLAKMSEQGMLLHSELIEQAAAHRAKKEK